MTVGPSALSALARGSSSTVRATRECMHWRTAMTTLGGGRRLSETSCPPRFSGATCACCGIETGGGDRTTRTSLQMIVGSSEATLRMFGHGVLASQPHVGRGSAGHRWRAMSKRVARWVATCRGRLSRAAGVRAVPKLEPYAGPSLRWCRRLTPSNFANSMTQFHDS